LAGHETDPERLLPNGDWTVGQLEALATVRDGAEPVVVRNAVAGAIRATGAERTRDPVVLDATLDRVQQAEQLVLADGSSFVLGYLGVHADVENVRTFVRVKALGEEKTSFEVAFLPGGTLTRAQLAEIWEEELDAVPGRLRMTPYARLAEEGIAGVRQGTMLRLERLSRERELKYLRVSRYMTFGYEPLFAYYLFRENEITNLRQLHAAKEAGLEESLCRETVAYVD
ncbi:MAG: V-type ATPase subunit, partial [candidate division WOR-3 bacterium]